MRQLVCWTVMGLVPGHLREVWKTLGTYATDTDAQLAADGILARGEAHQTRVMPYYRTSSIAQISEPATVIRREPTAAAADVHVGMSV